MGFPSLELQLFACTHTGLVRPHNEDAHVLKPQAGLAALADGLGGGRAGEVAASMAVALIAEELSGTPGASSHAPWPEAELLEREQALRRAVTNANSMIHGHSIQHPECAGMGTTLVLAQWCGAHLLVGHVGDSRAYLLRADPIVIRERHHPRWELRRLTRDHSTAQRVADERAASGGAGSPATVAHQPPRLTRALGVEPEVVLELHRHRLLPGDVVLLCSDGLSDLVNEDALESMMNRAWSSAGMSTRDVLKQTTEALVDAALNAGGPDNITVVLGTLASVPGEIHTTPLE